MRKELQERKDYLNKNMRHIIRIQAWVRGYQIRKNYLQLTQDKPSVQVNIRGRKSFVGKNLAGNMDWDMGGKSDL